MNISRLQANTAKKYKDTLLLPKVLAGNTFHQHTAQVGHRHLFLQELPKQKHYSGFPVSQTQL